MYRSSTISCNLARFSHKVPTIAPLTHARAYGSPSASAPSSPKKDSLSQGNAADPSNLHKQDVQSQSVKGAQGTRKNKTGGPVDAASTEKKTKPSETGKGNPEGVGMVDQVGSASGSAKQFEKNK
ncbi:hypothetical protein CVT26_003239 [Gymnopilus dilepis]|uniref:Uncharacterized protein n=1 Tax=Gymnopilus dilepis TaxID=231916 RepID=A0A409Y5A0_9AGAR|nr:hypothetical protein CVT26_003239 [Gymnopilus dilepis]